MLFDVRQSPSERDYRCDRFSQVIGIERVERIRKGVLNIEIPRVI